MERKGNKYSPKAYQVLLKTNQSRRILVEGKNDKQFFKLLLNEISQSRKSIGLSRINVDSASDLIDSQDLISNSEGKRGLGNRELVERTCMQVSGEPYAYRLIGFVDREFRGFEYSHNNSLEDKIENHYISNRIVWSRGHSIENYFFDKSILSETFKLYLYEDWFEDTLKLFEENFDSLMLIGSSISMTARDMRRLNKLEKSLEWTMLELSRDGLTVNTEYWEKWLLERKVLSADETHEFIESFFEWHARLKKVDKNIVRWVCHGHIGFKCILSLFKFCIVHTHPNPAFQNPDNFMGNFRDEKHFNFFTNIWLKKAIRNECEHPLEAFKGLGLDIL